jgi:D-lactate dehydrogenase (cytochrome)
MHEIYSKTAPEADFSQVKRIEGFENIQAENSAYLSDESKLSAKPFDYLFFPKSEGELAAVVKWLNRQKIPFTVAGARTGLVGGCVPQEGALISLEYLDKVIEVYWDEPSGEWRIKAQTSVSLKNLDSMLRVKQIPLLEQSPDEVIRRHYADFREDIDQYFYPPDPTEMSASLGGSVVTNASGARTYRYGPTRAWIRGMRVFLPNGEYLDIPRGKYTASPGGQFVVYDSKGGARTITIPDYPQPRTKSTAGFYTAPQMDLIDLFIGSEGVLGIVTSVDVALLRHEDKVSIIQFMDSDEQAVTLADALRTEDRIQLDFLEFYSGNALDLLRRLQREEPSTVGMPPIPENARAAVFFEMSFDPHQEDLDFSILEAVINGCGGSLERSWAGYESRELDRFKVFRHMVPETINSIIAERKKQYPDIHKLGTDMAVPDGHMREMWDLYRSRCEALQLEWCAFGHIGNNHIHVNILPRNLEELEKGMQLYEVFAQRAVELGGSVSAEHGIGKIKAKFLKYMFTPEQIEQMRSVKNALDPQNLLNPNDIFPVEVTA